MATGVVLAVAGAKGGVGKTTTSINLSAVLSKLGHDVVLVELDLPMANVGDFLDLDVRLEHGRDPTLHEVLAGAASIADATYEAPGGFDVVPSGTTLEGFANANIDAVADVVSDVRSTYTVVILDTGGGLGTETILPLSLADETILVSSPRVASVRDTKKTRDLVRHTGGTVGGIVFSKSGSGRSPGVDRIASFLSVDLLGHVPEDSAVASAQDIGRPVVVARKESDAAKAYRALGSRVHERIGALKAAQATRESEDAVSTGEDKGDTTLPAEDEDTNGFAFVDGPTEGGDTERSTDGHDSLDAPSTAQERDDNQERRADANTAHVGMETETSDRTRRADIQPTNRRAGERPVRSDENGENAGATDDEIAARLATADSEDGSVSGPKRQTTERQSAGGATPAEDEPPGSQSESSNSWEVRQSAAKRFIDRAVRMVDRRSD